MKAIGLFLLGLSLTISTSSAQPVYSANVVGYHTRDVPTGGICTLSNPLNGTNNQFNTVLRLPAWADGTMVHRWDPTLQKWLDPVQFYAGFGWFSPSDSQPTLNPGEGTFIWVPANSSNAQLRIEFVGELPAGTLCAPLVGGNQLNLWGPKFCQTLASIQPADGDTLIDFNCAQPDQIYREPFTYIAGFGWFSANPDDPGPQGPALSPGAAYWLQIPGPSRFPCGIPCLDCTPNERTSVEPVVLRNPVRSGTTFSFGMNTETNVIYQVQFAPLPCSSDSWTKFGAPITGTGQTVTITDNTAVGLTGFYRVAAFAAP